MADPDRKVNFYMPVSEYTAVAAGADEIGQTTTAFLRCAAQFLLTVATLIKNNPNGVLSFQRDGFVAGEEIVVLPLELLRHQPGKNEIGCGPTSP